MHIEKNGRGNIVIYQSKRMNKTWGFIDENKDYIGERDDKKSQIFHLYKNAIAIQLEVLTFLEDMKARDIKIRVKNYEREDFWAVIGVKEFRISALREFGNKAIFNYDKGGFQPYGLQIRLPLYCFMRIYDGQKVLKEVN